MKKILIGLLIVVATYQAKPHWFDFLVPKAGAYDDNGQPTALLFVNDTCGKPCTDAVNYFKSRSIPVEIDNPDTEEGYKRFRELGGGNRVPLLVVGDQITESFYWRRFNELSYAIVGDKALNRAQKQTFKHHFDETGSPKVVMYGTSWCGYCAQARKRMSELGIEYVEWDVEKNPSANRRYKVLESGGYPLIYVGAKRVGAYDENKILRFLKS